MSEHILQVNEALKAFALSFPGASEEFPWGESVIKVNKKIFVFFGLLDQLSERIFLGVKLPQSSFIAVDMPEVKPSAYGLGKYGWVNAQFGPEDALPVELFQEWIEESYRAIAPKKMVAQLDELRAAEV